MVQVDGNHVENVVSLLGVGVDGDVEVSAAQRALRLVHEVTSGRRAELQGLFREAAKLRRRAGKPRPVGTTPGGSARVNVPPVKFRGGVSFSVDVDGLVIRVSVFEEGGVMDDCDDWDRATDHIRDQAFSAVLDHLLSQSVETSDLGLDLALFRDLWG
jgi:hypothetical protein